MDDDLNISAALAAVFETMKALNINFDQIGQKDAEEVINFLKRVDEITAVLKFEEEIS